MREGPQTNGLFYMSGSESWSRGFGSSFCLCSNVIKPRQCHEQSRFQAGRPTKNIPPRPRRAVPRCAHSQEPHEEEVGEDGEHFVEDQGRGSFAAEVVRCLLRPVRGGGRIRVADEVCGNERDHLPTGERRTVTWLVRNPTQGKLLRNKPSGGGPGSRRIRSRVGGLALYCPPTFSSTSFCIFCASCSIFCRASCASCSICVRSSCTCSSIWVCPCCTSSSTRCCTSSSIAPPHAVAPKTSTKAAVTKTVNLFLTFTSPHSLDGNASLYER